MSETLTLPPTNRQKDIPRLLAKLEAFEPGKPINVTLSIARPERTPAQLKYLWGVAIPMLAQHAGYEKEDVHEYLCGLHFGWKPKRKPGGKVEDVPIRTTTVDADGNRDVIDGDAFWDYVEFVQRFGARVGVVIPDPDLNYKIKKRAKRDA